MFRKGRSNMSKVVFSMIKSGFQAARSFGSKAGTKITQKAMKKALEATFNAAQKSGKVYHFKLTTKEGVSVSSSASPTLQALLSGNDKVKPVKTLELVNGEVKEVTDTVVASAVTGNKRKPMKIAVLAQWFRDEILHAKNTGTEIRNVHEIWKDEVRLDGWLGKLFAKLKLKKGSSLREYMKKEISKATARGEVSTFSVSKGKLLEVDALNAGREKISLVARDVSDDEIRSFFTQSDSSSSIFATREPIKICV